jgi:hypothetical protein
MIRLVGIDIDGTLLDSQGRMPDANRAAIHAVVAAGVHVALVTGRSYPFARPVADTLPSKVTLIVSNGAVERGMDGSTLARRLLERRMARTVLEATRAHRAAAALIFDRDEDRQVVYETMDWDHPGRQRYWSRNHSRIAQSIPLEAALDEDPIQVMFNGGVDDMRRLREELQAGVRDCSILVTEYEARDFSLVDVMSKNVTKGLALAWRAEQLGLDRSQVMGIGDNFNDLEMLEFVGTPVVMANAVQSLRSRGWHATSHQNEGGVAQALERFVLNG